MQETQIGLDLNGQMYVKYEDSLIQQQSFESIISRNQIIYRIYSLIIFIDIDYYFNIEKFLNSKSFQPKFLL
ncbi:hypothetical protein FGO68_gene6513 [Halteria grandinella]|uniref:Uncharacterized protein n=1 Tax=Halteria grandinella TaxID=5974 RepID=A0A8J8NFU4_HALGN|nr:hypothetical protein FGO68_gene6513 [Halteria grandinella]